MDRKGLIVLGVSFVLLMLWFPLVNRLYPPIPTPLSSNIPSPASSNQVTAVTNPVAEPPPAEPVPTTPPPTSDASPTVPTVPSTAKEEQLVLEDEESRITLTSHGGGIKLVELKKHQESISCNDKEHGTNNQISLNTLAPLPVLTLLGAPDIQGDNLYTLTRLGDVVRAEKALSNGLHVVKEFQILSNHLISARIQLKNGSDTTLAIPPQEYVTGTATPINVRDQGLYLGVYWYNGKKAQHVDEAWYANRFLGCFPGTPRSHYQAGAGDVFWVSVHNQFFTLTTIPESPAAEIRSTRPALPPPSLADIQADSKAVRNPHGLLSTLVYPGTNLASGAVLEQHFQIYAGPKAYNTLARLGQRMNNNLDLVMGYSGFFGFFAKVLLLSMNGLNGLGLSYGLAIIAITVIIKLLFWPLTNASTKSMKRMAALQPQMKALQEKFKDDPVKMNRKLMEFMKEHKVSPLGGCLPMLLQIPVFFGFYRMILSATELRGAQFLWACDLSKPDTLFTIPGFNIPFNPLPLIMGVTMLWQARLTPPSPGMDPVQQKIMKYMPLMFLVILYNFSAGLTLYWTVQNLLTIAQMKLTRTKEEPASSGPGAAVVAASPKPAASPTPVPPRRPKKKR